MVAADGTGQFDIIGGSRAGDSNTTTVSSGKVCYITTGGCLPAGADAVVMVEETETVSSDRVRVLKAAAPGQNIRQPSSDMAVGDQVLAAGNIVGPAEVGLLASVGAVAPVVCPQAVVAIASTGDELADADAPVVQIQVWARPSRNTARMGVLQSHHSAEGGIQRLRSVKRSAVC